jgi:hypothetical protein
MTVQDLINKLRQYDPKLPICIDDSMGFAEAYEKSIKVERKSYMCFPFTEHDKFEYINLKGEKFDY